MNVNVTDPQAARHVLHAFAHGIIGTIGTNGVVPRFVEVDGLAGFLRPTINMNVFELWPEQDDISGQPLATFDVTHVDEVVVR